MRSSSLSMRAWLRKGLGTPVSLGPSSMQRAMLYPRSVRPPLLKPACALGEARGMRPAVLITPRLQRRRALQVVTNQNVEPPSPPERSAERAAVLQARVAEVVYSSESSGFSVLRVEQDGNDTPAFVVG